MVKFNFSYGSGITIEQRIGFEMAAVIWGCYITDVDEINLQIGAVNNLNEGSAVGGAVPILHEQTYGVFREYYQQDTTPSEDEARSVDEQANDSLQTGNTVDLMVDGELLDGNTEILLTSAQAKALGMDEAFDLGHGTTWNRDLVDDAALDGYIVINNDFDWNYDFARTGEAAEGTLDFLSMALHEIGHNMGFISGLDGTVDVEQLHSGETRISDFTVLDLFRHSLNTARITNPDGSVSTVTEGEAAYLSVDGGQTNLGDLATGLNGDGSQASHWKRLQNAMGIMDPTLAYRERMTLSERDLKAMDALGWDVDYEQLSETLDLSAVLVQAETAAAEDLGITGSFLSENRGVDSLYELGYSEWFSLFEGQISEIGIGSWWQIVELGYGIWQDSQDSLDSDNWLSQFEAQLLQSRGATWMQEIEYEFGGYGGSWFEQFQAQLTQTGGATWMQILEVGYQKWWQNLETYFSTVESADNLNADRYDNSVVSYGDSSIVVNGGDEDDILTGNEARDLITGGGGDDLVDGKGGSDTILGGDGNDVLYGFTGDDRLYGGSGDDLLAGEDNDDALFGEAGHDMLAGGFGNDQLDGGAGKDLLKGDFGHDVLNGGRDDDDVSGGEGNDIAVGGDGEDIVSGGRGSDVLYGDFYVQDVTQEAVETHHTAESISKQEGLELGESSPVDFWIRMEAEEDFNLRNFSERSSANGDFVTTGGRGQARAKFSGATGIYDIIVGYYDEADGKSAIDIEIGDGHDKQRFAWTWNQELGNNGVGADNFTTYTIQGVEIEAGEDIQIKGQANGGEFVRWDYVDIISTTQGTAFENAEFYNGNLYLQGQSETSATALGGELVQTEQGSVEDYWLSHKMGGTAGVAKVDITGSQFNLRKDKATLEEKQTILMEAESFHLSGGYEFEARTDFSSGTGVIKNTGSGSGLATSTFTGESGIYNIFVGYVEQGSGTATASLSINGEELKEWGFYGGREEKAEYRGVSAQVSLNYGDAIELKGTADNLDLARIDYLEFISADVDIDADVMSVDEAVDIPAYVGEETIIEAESVWFSGSGHMGHSSRASGGEYAAIRNAQGSTLFTGETGLYDIFVRYWDNNNSNARLGLKVNNELQDNWTVDRTGSHEWVERSVATSVNLTSYSDYLVLGGESWNGSNSYTDYIKLVRVDDSSQAAPTSQVLFGSDNLLIQGENIHFSGSSSVKESSITSGGKYANLYDATGSVLFEGETGYYDIVVSYWDNGASAVDLSVKVNEETQSTWKPNQTADDAFVERTVASGVRLTNAEDYVQLISNSNGDFANIDYIKLVKVDAPSDDSGAGATVADADNNDVLRGGQGNDVVYGGQGNDIIYGEDEFDNGLNEAGSNNDKLYGGSGDDKIYGNSGDDELYGGGGEQYETVSSVETVVFQQGVNGYSGTVDTTIMADAASTNLGAQDTLNADRHDGAYDEMAETQGLLRFKNIFGDEPGRIDGQSTINSAFIELQVESTGNAVNVYEMSKLWTENTTWNSYVLRGDGNGIQVGAEVSDTPVATTGYVGAGTLRIDVTDSLRTWQTNPDSNYGWSFLSTGSDGVDFYSSESSYVPRLIVDVQQTELVSTATTSDNDQLFGGLGSDRLEGGRGNDTLDGGSDNDRLDGSDTKNHGVSEIDVLGGGLGSDTFVLGSATKSYYLGDNRNDYARIVDFDAAVDVIQLHGSAGDYGSWQHNGDLNLLRGGDLVAIVEGHESLDLNGSGVIFV